MSSRHRARALSAQTRGPYSVRPWSCCCEKRPCFIKLPVGHTQPPGAAAYVRERRRNGKGGVFPRYFVARLLDAVLLADFFAAVLAAARTGVLAGVFAAADLAGGFRSGLAAAGVA